MYKYKLDSSNIASAEYSNGILFIEFHNGSIYRYSNVSQEMFSDFLNADSHGQYFHYNIKIYPGMYPYKRIR